MAVDEDLSGDEVEQDPMGTGDEVEQCVEGRGGSRGHGRETDTTTDGKRQCMTERMSEQHGDRGEMPSVRQEGEDHHSEAGSEGESDESERDGQADSVGDASERNLAMVAFIWKS